MRNQNRGVVGVVLIVVAIIIALVVVLMLNHSKHDTATLSVGRADIKVQGEAVGKVRDLTGKVGESIKDAGKSIEDAVR